MSFDLEGHYTARGRRLVTSEIREILKMMYNQDLISFAGGMPNPDTFPLKAISEIAQEVLTDSPVAALQYGPTEGYPPLRQTIADLMTTKGVDCTAEEVMVVSGAQQTIDLAAQLLVEAGGRVITGSPSFLAALISFRGYGAHIEGVPLDDEGYRLDILEERLRGMRREGVRPSLLYVIPNFQNPTGVTLSEARRRRVVDLANEHDMMVLEDDPYHFLRFEGRMIPPIRALDDTGRVIYTSSFSKILSPGMRLGWVVAHPEIIRKMTIIKQTTDVCTNMLSQLIADRYVSSGRLDQHLPVIRDLYRRKQRIMLASMDKHFPEEARWTRPEGGMFIWTELQETIDTQELLVKALKRKVAFVHGRLFFPDGSGRNTMRLSYSHPKDECIEEGIRRLGELISEELKRG